MPRVNDFPPIAPQPVTPLVWPLIALLLLLLGLGANGYGYFRDELYYLACADHLAWGYVDQPPLSIAVLAAWKAGFGTSMLALRTPPALLGATTLWLTARMTARLGGDGVAQVLAASCVLMAPIFLAFHGYYSLNAFDLLFWTLAQAWLVDRLRDTAPPRPRAWLHFGLVLGLGLLNKISVLWLIAGVFIGLLSGPQRRWFLKPGPWLAAAVAVLLFAPFLLWQAQHHWAMLEFIRNASGNKYLPSPPLQFLGQLAMTLLPLTAPIWIGGVLWSLAGPERQRYRPLGIAWLVVLAILLLNGTSKAEYFAAMQPFFFAAGAVAVVRLLRPAWRGLPWTYVTVMLIGGAAAAPLVVPLLPIPVYIDYAAALGFAPSTSEHKTIGVLPQHYADRQGWPELAQAVARAWDTIPPDEREHAIIVTDDYGQAGAIDFFGPALGLPPARSQHNNYYLWGTGPGDGSVVVLLSRDSAALREEFTDVRVVGTFHHPYVMPYENDLPITVARGLKLPLAVAWARGRHYE